MASILPVLRTAALLSAMANMAGALADEPTAPVPTARRTESPSAADHRPQWELAFDDFIAADEYAAQLDFFKIEIAAIAADGKIETISNVRQRRPDKRLGAANSDPRIWIGWKRGTLEAIDRRLLAHAGINTKNKQIVHFLPEALQKRLASMERAYARRDASEIKRTRFRIEPSAVGDGYEFVVVDQDPPRPAGTAPAARSQNKPQRPE